MTDSWHIYRVKAGMETEVAKALGVAAYVPRVLARRYDRRRRVAQFVYRAMLPGYVFLGAQAPNKARGGLGYLRNADGSRAVLTPSAYALLRHTEKSIVEEALRAHRNATRPLCVDERLKLNLGGVKELEAVVQEIVGSTVRVSVPGSALTVSVPTHRALEARL